MPIRSQRLVPHRAGVSMLNVENSWASQVLASATTNIKDMARFQQRQLAEKEQKLLQIYDQQQLRAHQVAQRGSAGSNGSNSSAHGNSANASHQQTTTKTSTSTHATSNSQGGGKVRQMFDERRQTTVKGIDKSYPLEPLDNRSRKHQTVTTTMSNVTVNSSSPLKNGNPMSNNRRGIVTRRTVRSEANSNVNDGKPIVTYREEVSREISGDATNRDNEQEEFGDENFQASRYENGNRRIDRPGHLDIEDVTNENTNQRHITTAKIHLTEFDKSTEDRTCDDLENEQFPNDESIGVPDGSSRRSSIEKQTNLSETRHERLKNSNVKKIGQAIKQNVGNITSFTKKRNETTVHSRPSSRASTVTRTMEEEISRASSTSPEFEGNEKSRNSSRKLSDNEKKIIISLESRSPVIKKSTGITKVSQIFHKNSTDYYPRRKSEFEKSKTFRKLQLELGESSPEPYETEQVCTIVYGKPGKKRSSILDDNIYSPEPCRSSSTSPIHDRAYSKERKLSQETSIERPGSRRGSCQRPAYRRESLISSEERKTSTGGIKTSSLQSDTYSSRRRSSSSRPNVDYDFTKERKTYNERPESRTDTQSPIYRKESVVKSDERKATSEGVKTMRIESDSIYSSRRRSSDFSKERNKNHEKSPAEHRETRKTSESPIYRRESRIKNEERKTTNEGMKTSSLDSSTYSSRRHSSNRNNSLVNPDDSKERRTSSHVMSHEGPRSLERSPSPIYRKRSSVKDEERGTTDCAIDRSTLDHSSTRHCSRRRSSSSSSFVDRDFSKNGKMIHEKSPERPASPEEYSRPTCRAESVRNNEVREKSNFQSSTYSSRHHSSSPTPSVNFNLPEDEITRPELTHERRGSRERSHSPYDRGQSIERNNEKTTRISGIRSNFDSSTFSSRNHSFASGSIDYHDLSKERKTSHDISHERPRSRERSQSPDYETGSMMKNREKKTTIGGINLSNFDSSTYSSRQHSSSAISGVDRNFSEERSTSHDISHEGSRSRERSQSPKNYERQSRMRNEKIPTTTVGIEASNYDSSTYSSRQRSSSPISGVDRDFSVQRPTSHEISHEGSRSRERSRTPTYQRESYVKNNEEKRKTSSFESSTYSSRCHSSSPTPITLDHDYSQEREIIREKSPERPESRRASQSPTQRRSSMIDKEDRETTSERVKNLNRDSSTYCSRRRSSSSGPIVERDYSNVRESRDDRKDSIAENNQKSGVTLRSFELVKKLVRPSGPEKKPIPTTTKESFEGKVTLEDIEFPAESSNLREARKSSKSPEHKIVKKDKAPVKIVTKNDKSVKTRDETNYRDTRSGKRSPSPTSPGTMRETLSFRAKKNERKNSGDSKNPKEFIDLTNDKQTCKFNSDIERTIEEKESRRSSVEINVKRDDLFKTDDRSNRRVLKIDNEKVSDKNEDLSFNKKIPNQPKDKRQLLERIEKIRGTLSRSGGRSEQNLRSKEYERTDSVESALKRFDSIGVETEHRVTVGVDETDIFSTKATSANFQRSSNDKKIPVNEKIVVKKLIKPLCKSTKIIVAPLTAQTRKNNVKSRVSSRENLTRVNLREKLSDVGKSAKTKRERSIITVTTPRRNDDNKMLNKSREGQKRMTSIVKKSKLHGEETSGRGEQRRCELIDDSPICKRKLFQDSESEIENENKNSRSTIVLTSIARSTTNDNPEIIEIETMNNRENLNKSVDNILQMSTSLGDMKNDDNEQTKVLRSIEDIRKSIKRESQDFKRELNKFNTAMRRDEEISSTEKSDTVASSGILSCVRITKTLKSSDRKPIIKIERSSVKLPIDRRVAKSPSPDIGTKRLIDGRARTTSGTVRRNVMSSPAKSPDTNNRYGSSELKSPGTKSLGRTSSSPGSRESRNQTEFTTTTEYTDGRDGPTDDSEVIVTEIVSTITTKKNNDALVEDYDDYDVSGSKDDASNRCKSAIRKRSSERSLTSRKHNESPTNTPLSRPTSALSTTSSSATSARGKTSGINSKSKMSTITKTPTSNGPKGPSSNTRNSSQASENDGLAPCKICGRRFNSDRVARHEQICSKTTTKKRKQFDATIHRVRGTELEPFVKKGGAKKGQADRKAQKPEVKSNWRRKHEDFINAIRSAKQVQAHLAAGGKLSDLPPPPPSDTSDYVQCPHCGRKFAQAAADRHIPKCQSMMHNKPNPRAPPKPKR